MARPGTDRNSHATTGSATAVRSGRHKRPNLTSKVKLLDGCETEVAEGPPGERIAAIATHQRGRVAHRQLTAVGITPSMIKCRLNSGELHLVHRGVYVVGHNAPVSFGDETAAILCHPSSVLSHHSAAALWRIRSAPVAVPEITLRAGGPLRRSGIISHRSATLLPIDVCIHNGLPVTSPARTLFDIAPGLTNRERERALDEALATRITSLFLLGELVERHPNRAAALKALLRDRTTSTRTRSHPEEEFLTLIRQAHLPQPQVNARLHGFEVDFYWPEQRLVVELDGYQWHSTKSAFERDHRKDSILRAHAITVSRFSARQVRDESYAVVADVTRRLAAAA